MSTLPASDYHDPGVHDVERQIVFGREWQFVCSARSLATPGAYVATTVAGWPLVVVNDDGGLRAFHNVCRHRAGPLLDDGDGTARSFVCRYHGWSYDLDGRLRTARDSGLDSESTAGLCLFGMRVATWRGLVFVCLDRAEDRAPDLETWLGDDFVEHCAGFPLESWEPSEQIEHIIDCNWKTYGDNYLEGYHIPFVHPALARSIDTSSYEVEVHGDWARHRAVARDGATATGVWLWHWPNLALNLYEHGASVERWDPLSPTQCRLRLDFLFADTEADPDAMARNRQDIEASAQICLEDKRICEAVQRNLDAGVYDHGELAPRHESGVAAFQARLSAARAAAEGEL